MEIVCRMKTTNSSALEYNVGVQWWTRIGMLLSIQWGQSTSFDYSGMENHAANKLI